MALDGSGGMLAYGTFDGFDDGITISPAQGLARFIHSDVVLATEPASVAATRSRVYPVPAKDVAWLEWSSGTLAYARMYDMAGSEVALFASSGLASPLAIDLQPHAPGSYVLRAVLDDGRSLVHRIHVLP